MTEEVVHAIRFSPAPIHSPLTQTKKQHSKKRYSGARLWPFGPLVCLSFDVTVDNQVHEVNLF